MRLLAVVVVALMLAAPAFAWTPRSASALIERQVHAGLVQQLFEITGSRVWQTHVRCVSRDPVLTRFACAAWSQNLRRTQDFWTTKIRVRCSGPMTECEWVALNRFAGPWDPGG